MIQVLSRRSRPVCTYMKEGVVYVSTMVSVGNDGDTRKEWPSVYRRVRKGFIEDIEATVFYRNHI